MTGRNDREIAVNEKNFGLHDSSDLSFSSICLCRR
jgi:hypothetical protein